MTNFTHYRPDEVNNLLRNFVRAERINDIVANQTSRRYLDYFAYIRDMFAGERPQYREIVKVPHKAVEAYEQREGRFVDMRRFYRHQDTEIRICATPHAVDGDLGLTFTNKEMGPEMYRFTQAMMLVTGLPEWGVVNEDGKIERMWYDTVQARDLEEQMIAFLFKAQRRAVA